MAEEQDEVIRQSEEIAAAAYPDEDELMDKLLPAMQSIEDASYWLGHARRTPSSDDTYNPLGQVERAMYSLRSATSTLPRRKRWLESYPGVELAQEHHGEKMRDLIRRHQPGSDK